MNYEQAVVWVAANKHLEGRLPLEIQRIVARKVDDLFKEGIQKSVTFIDFPP